MGAVHLARFRLPSHLAAVVEAPSRSAVGAHPDSPGFGPGHCRSSEAIEYRLKRDALVWVETAVEGRLDSQSGVDSTLLQREPRVQSG